MDGEGSTEGRKQNCFHRSPHIVAKIFNIPIPMLIDSGSQVTCVSESFFNHLRVNGEILILPVSNIVIVPAIGRKQTPVKHQAFFDLEIGECRIVFPFLIIPR